jgi:hypothetical protein
MTGTEIYKRTATYEKEARNIRIHAPHWKLLLAFDGQRTLSEVALSAETSFADAVPLTQKFLDSKWIAEEPITLEQYLKRAGAKDISATGASVAPAVVLHEPEKDKPAAATPAPAPSPAPSFIVPPPPFAAKTEAATPPSPPPLPPAGSKTAAVPASALPPEKTAPPKSARPMKLAAVVDYITSLAGNISLGQLLVYRVFLRVPPDLLLAEDIASVHLANDTSVIQGDKLQKAIADALNAVAKKALPDSVYAAA